MAESLKNKRWQELLSKNVEKTPKQNILENALIDALKDPSSNPYSKSNKNFSHDAKLFIGDIIDIGENLKTIATPENQEYINQLSPYILALATHPFLSLDKDENSRKNSLMYANEKLFEFELDEPINFDKFKDACEIIAKRFSGFPKIQIANVDYRAQLPKQPSTEASAPTQQPLSGGAAVVPLEQGLKPQPQPAQPGDNQTKATGNIPQPVQPQQPQTVEPPKEEPIGWANYIWRSLKGLFGY